MQVKLGSLLSRLLNSIVHSASVARDESSVSQEVNAFTGNLVN